MSGALEGTSSLKWSSSERDHFHFKNYLQYFRTISVPWIMELINWSSRLLKTVKRDWKKENCEEEECISKQFKQHSVIKQQLELEMEEVVHKRAMLAVQYFYPYLWTLKQIHLCNIYLVSVSFLILKQRVISVILLSFLRVVQTIKHFKVKFKDTWSIVRLMSSSFSRKL